MKFRNIADSLVSFPTQFLTNMLNDAEENNIFNLFKFFPQNFINFASFPKHTKENY